MKYLCLLAGEPGSGPAPGTAEFQQMLADFGEATSAMAAAGVLVDSGPLQPPETATTVQVREGETLLMDGPFAEIKEHLGGFVLIEARDMEEATAIAATFPVARYGMIEVRAAFDIRFPNE